MFIMTLLSLGRITGAGASTDQYTGHRKHTMNCDSPRSVIVINVIAANS